MVRGICNLTPTAPHTSNLPSTVSLWVANVRQMCQISVWNWSWKWL